MHVLVGEDEREEHQKRRAKKETPVHRLAQLPAVLHDAEGQPRKDEP